MMSRLVRLGRMRCDGVRSGDTRGQSGRWFWAYWGWGDGEGKGRGRGVSGEGRRAKGAEGREKDTARERHSERKTGREKEPDSESTRRREFSDRRAPAPTPGNASIQWSAGGISRLVSESLTARPTALSFPHILHILSHLTPSLVNHSLSTPYSLTPSLLGSQAHQKGRICPSAQ